MFTIALGKCIDANHMEALIIDADAAGSDLSCIGRTLPTFHLASFALSGRYIVHLIAASSINQLGRKFFRLEE